jgi:flavocytochrome c
MAYRKILGQLVVIVLICCGQVSANDERTTDIVIVGAGIAGLTAALEAGAADAKVEVFDIASVFGGHAVMSEGGLSIVDTPLQREKGIADSPELAFNDFITWGEDANTDWVRYYVEHSKEDIYDWLVNLGVKFHAIGRHTGNSVPRFHRVAGRGPGLVTPIYEACLRRNNISFHWQEKLVEIIKDGDAVSGVVVENLVSHERATIRAKAVILATGGFQNNLTMVRKNWPKELPLPHALLAGSGEYSVGWGHEAARKVGAAFFNLDHQWIYTSGLPDPRYPGTQRGVFASVTNSIWVNLLGRRFTDESQSTKFNLPVVLAQEEGSFWTILDERSKSSAWVSGHGWDARRIEEMILSNADLIHSANSIRELANELGLTPESLEETLMRYNHLVETGSDEHFGRFGPNTPTAKIPPKIEVAPFYALKQVPVARKSMGGIAVNMDCAVVDEEKRVIPGLYAIGEAAGFGGINGRAALEGTFLGPSIVMGHVAGRMATGIGTKQ